jgi:hypothetical protein
MGHPGLDPSTALQLIQTLFYSIAWVLAGSLLLALSAYVFFLCVEIFSPQPSSKARLAELPHPVGCAPVAEENLDLAAAEAPILVEAERLGEEAVRVPALSQDAQTPMTFIPVTLGSEPIGPWGFLDFLRFRRSAVLRKRGSSLIADARLEKLA